jgi:hypothetical protein
VRNGEGSVSRSLNEKDELKQFIFKFNTRAEEVDIFSSMTHVCEIDIVEELDP